MDRCYYYFFCLCIYKSSWLSSDRPLGIPRGSSCHSGQLARLVCGFPLICKNSLPLAEDNKKAGLDSPSVETTLRSIVLAYSLTPPLIPILTQVHTSVHARGVGEEANKTQETYQKNNGKPQNVCLSSQLHCCMRISRWAAGELNIIREGY